MVQDPSASYEPDALDGHIHLKRGTGGSFSPAAALRPGQLLPFAPKAISVRLLPGCRLRPATESAPMYFIMNARSARVRFGQFG